MEISRTLCCSIWPPSGGIFFPLISNRNFPHCNLCQLSFTLLLHTSKKLGCFFSVPSNWVVKDSDVIFPPTTFSLLRTEHTQLSSVSSCTSLKSIKVCNVVLFLSLICRAVSLPARFIITGTERKVSCEGLWKITADTVISARNSGLNRMTGLVSLFCLLKANLK